MSAPHNADMDNADSPNPSALSLMQALRDQLRERLAANEDYRALLVVEAGIDELRKAAAPRQVKRHDVGSNRPPRQSDIAYQILDQAGRPLTIAELVDRFAQEGHPVGGNDPKMNLASTLSKDDRFESVKIGGLSRWWIQGRVLELFQREFGGAQTP